MDNKQIPLNPIKRWYQLTNMTVCKYCYLVCCFCRSLPVIIQNYAYYTRLIWLQLFRNLLSQLPNSLSHTGPEKMLTQVTEPSGQSEIPLSFNGIDKVAVAVQRQRVIHTETIKFASQPQYRHISTFRGYRILFSIINLI